MTEFLILKWFSCCCWFVVPSKFGSFQPLDRPGMLSVPARRSAAKPLNAEPKRNNSIVSAAATVFAPGNISI